MKRKIIEIDREKCNGCGDCLTACAEGALALDEENKAVLVKEIYCDGMGACLDVCPEDALKVIEKESGAYDAKATYVHVKNTLGEDAAKNVHGIDEVIHKPEAKQQQFSGCPGSKLMNFERQSDSNNHKENTGTQPSELSQWPIQLHLISPYAPYFQGCDLLIAADCTAFALGSFHRDLLKGKRLIIACPKLDDTNPYLEKLTELFKNNQIKSLTVAIMTVPCCHGLSRLIEKAVELSGQDIDVKNMVIDLKGSMTEKEAIIKNGLPVF